MNEIEAPELLPRWLSPTPVIIAGIIGFFIATIICALAGWDRALSISAVGMGVGLFGASVVAIQKRAVRRGAKGAQQGLEKLT